MMMLLRSQFDVRVGRRTANTHNNSKLRQLVQKQASVRPDLKSAAGAVACGNEYVCIIHMSPREIQSTHTTLQRLHKIDCSAKICLFSWVPVSASRCTLKSSNNLNTPN